MVGHGHAESLFLRQLIVGLRFQATRLRVAALPREATCTENLTPWIKMLPCKSKVIVNSARFSLLHRVTFVRHRLDSRSSSILTDSTMQISILWA